MDGAPQTPLPGVKQSFPWELVAAEGKREKGPWWPVPCRWLRAVGPLTGWLSRERVFRTPAGKQAPHPKKHD